MTKKNIPQPVVYKVQYNQQDAEHLDNLIRKSTTDKESNLLINYPTVYVIDNPHNPKQKDTYIVYVGETNDIQRRTLQHLDEDPKGREDWDQFKAAPNSQMYVIGHKHFNKSLTLDIENRLMQYLSSVDVVSQLNNRRGNERNDYFTRDEFEPIFNKIWHRLHSLNADLFPEQKLLQESALFKASPFNKLTREQIKAKKEILAAVHNALKTDQREQLILVEGEAGAGKTVLMSNIFYDLAQSRELKPNNSLPTVSLMVPHPQQLKVYEEIYHKLHFGSKAEVIKVPTFINRHRPDHPVDIAFIDEAHLLLTQHSQAFYGHGTNELLEVAKRAKVVLAIYDPKQVLQSTQQIEADDRKEINRITVKKIFLHNQLRIDASPAMIHWLRKVIDEQIIDPAPEDDRYELKVFDSPAEMEKAIDRKAKSDERNGISRMIATFDWDYSSSKKKDKSLWEVREGTWHMPWNLQLKPDKKERHEIRGIKYSDLSWAEQPHTINEVGSTYTVQGSDLNYAGLEIGPSVKYRAGRIVFDPAASKDKKAIQKRTMHDKTAKSFAEQDLKNAFNVLMTRGVHGLYLHAVDPELQAALKRAINH